MDRREFNLGALLASMGVALSAIPTTALADILDREPVLDYKELYWQDMIDAMLSAPRGAWGYSSNFYGMYVSEARRKAMAEGFDGVKVVYMADDLRRHPLMSQDDCNLSWALEIGPGQWYYRPGGTQIGYHASAMVVRFPDYDHVLKHRRYEPGTRLPHS